MSKDKTTDDGKDLPGFCYLQVSIAGQVQPKPIVIRLHKEACPKTCRNFVALCTNNEERTSPQRPIATYCGSQFHRIVPNFMCQAGDFERFDGTGGYSPIYHGGRFNDENLTGKHDQEGVVSMANAGKNTNKSQFFITLKATPHLDGKHVVFGQVVSGMESVHAMTTVEREGDRPVPLQRIVIGDCGVGVGQKEKEDTEKDKDESGRKRSKKKHKKHSKSKRHYKDDEDDGSRHRDRKKRKKHRHSHRGECDDSVSSSSSSVSTNDDSRDHRNHSRHRRKRRSRSEDRHERKRKYSSHRKRSRSSKRNRHKRSDSSRSSSESSSNDGGDYKRDHGRRRKSKHKSKHSCNRIYNNKIYYHPTSW